ncbi:TRAP transporter small permease [Bradyrhizobium sediminis]|uniref:TRAP transporter small permease protein n=1 Tax=Bradyrhizobium sediminis TaxID=2840469 RepID=A0A975RVI6_9BRAD|nr:TRAP transporter small permease [Bradyrhizobium sediminis]QWG22182.1 TRAP transporter small permease [Bradyrhizobium sediminis]
MTNLLKFILQWVAALMLLAIVLIVLSNVFFRYFLHVGLGWTEEAARFLLIALTFVAAAAAVKEWGHFQLLIATKWIPEKYHRLVQLFAVLVVLLLSVILVRYGIAITQVSWFQTSPTMEWSMGYLYSIVPASGVVMFLFALEHFVNVWRGGSLPRHGTVPDEHPVTHGPAGSLPEQRTDQWL